MPTMCNGSSYQYIMFTINNIEYFKTHLVLEIFFNAVLAISATLGNALIICAILKSQNLQTPSYLLITSLAFTDLLVGMLHNPLTIALYVFYLKKDIVNVCVFDSVSDVVSVSLAFLALTMSTYIAVDRYLAVHLRHRYKTTVTKRLVQVLIVITWATFLPFVVSIQQVNQWQSVLASLGLVQVFIICTFYIMAFVALKRYTSQINAMEPSSSNNNFDVVKYRKTFKKMLVILGCFLACFAPAILTYAVAFQILGTTRVTVILSRLSFTILTVNSSINPVIYLVWFKDIRLASRQILGL